MIRSSYFYTQLNLEDGTPILLDIYHDEEDAERHFRDMNDKNIIQDSFAGLTNIPPSEYAGLSLIKVWTKYGRQTAQECIKRKDL